MRQSVISLSCAAVLVCARLIPASAQPATGAEASPVPIRLGKAVVPLTGPWKFHIGDDPRWADPGYNDSAWETVDLTPQGAPDLVWDSSDYVLGWTSRGHPGYSGYAWYRLRVAIESPGAPLALLLPAIIEDGYQVYADGREIGHFGDLTRHPPVLYVSTAKWFPLPSAAPGHPTQLALRFYMHPASLAMQADVGGLHAPPWIGANGVIAAFGTLAGQQLLIRGSVFLLGFVVYSGFSFALLALYGLDRTEDVYLWFGLAHLVLALAELSTFGGVGSGASIAELRMELYSLQLAFGAGWLLLMLTGWWRWFPLTDQRWLLRLVWAFVLCLFLARLGKLPPFLGTVVPLTAVPALRTVDRLSHLGIGLLFIVLVGAGLRRQSREGWLVLPAAVLLMVALFSTELTLLRIRTAWTIFGLRIALYQIAQFGLSAALGILIIRRFQRSQRRKQQLEADLRQAQQVQQVLLPQAIPVVPGFHIECEYRPAQEVGGDFFQVLETRAGGVLVVIGDVSGKGVHAAMLVALIVGALRTIAEDSENPAAILERLNRRLVGRMEGGLATCLCARLDLDGSLTIANAGHLAPWLDGGEMEVPHDLPLGLAEGIEYAARVLRLPENGTLSFVTDGVVEARNSRRELFGFDRTRALSTRSAQQIAEAAEQFGQDDDITVVRVQLSPVPALVLNV